MRNLTLFILIFMVIVFSSSFKGLDTNAVNIVEVCITETIIVEVPLKGTIATIPKGNPVLEDQIKSVSSHFGLRLHPILNIIKFHNGVDISADKGTNVYSTSYGVVDFAGKKGGYGQCVIVKSGDYTIYYAHLDVISVKKGDLVTVGVILGQVGSSGLATGDHLHYEIRYQNKPINPRSYALYDKA